MGTLGVPFQFFNNRIYDKAHRMPGELSFGSAFYNNDGFGDNGHFRFEYNVNYEFFQIDYTLRTGEGGPQT